MAEWIIGHFPRHRVYVEPFGGAASVLIQKPRSYAEIYNDLDGEIVNVFRVLRDSDRAFQLREALLLTPFALEEFKLSYTPHTNDIEQARRTIVRAFMGFGSNSSSGAKTGFRSDSNRSGTTPAHDWKNYPSALPALCERLSGVVIDCRDAAYVMARYDSPDTLHYLDPPYLHATRKSASTVREGKGYRHEMTDGDHRKLAQFLAGLEGMVVLSGYPSSLYEELYKDWHRIERPALADGARKRTEVLWLNDAAWSGQQSPLLGLGQADAAMGRDPQHASPEVTGA